MQNCKGSYTHLIYLLKYQIKIPLFIAFSLIFLNWNWIEIQMQCVLLKETFNGQKKKTVLKIAVKKLCNMRRVQFIKYISWLLFWQNINNEFSGTKFSLTHRTILYRSGKVLNIEISLVWSICKFVLVFLLVFLYSLLEICCWHFFSLLTTKLIFQFKYLFSLILSKTQGSHFK